MSIIAGIATLIGLTVLLALLHGILRGSSQFMNMLLAYSYLSLPIKCLGWFGAAWAGMSVFSAMGG
ncbi:hypothetical protein [Devosia sp. 2618]|uniref:hypothetical protein n=1 Tax=Devosia sp. 2618 TaxID=3156454 RepID=UPI003391F5BA